MIKTLAGVPILAAALLALHTAAPAAAQTVVTHLKFQDPGSFTVPAEGELRATFRAAKLADGSWSVTASYAPRHLLVAYQYWDLYWIWREVQASATTTSTVQANTPISTTATGMYYTKLPSQGGQQVDLYLQCTFTVDDAGTVLVQSIHF